MVMGISVGLICKYLLICLLIGGTAGDVEFNLDGRLTIDPEKEEENIFDILSKQNNNTDSSLGRSNGKEPVLIQGDIIKSDTAKDLLALGRTTRNRNMVLLWPRTVWRTREVPYIIDSFYPYSAGWKAILAAFRKIESVSCLKYRPKRRSDKAWIRVYRGKSWWANIGRSFGFGETEVSIGSSTSQLLIIHELVHALGFAHEQARRDRDNYVKVLSWNIQPSNLYNFDKVDIPFSENFGMPYDFSSIMHYSRTTFTKNGRDTLVAKNDPNRKFGGKKLSKYDIAKINAMYHCHDKKGTIWTEWSDWSPCIKNKKGCYRSKHRICLADSLASCPEADDYGVHSIPLKCPTAAHCHREAVDGFWSQWASWSRCTKTCDKGTKTRSRRCDTPRPSNGGRKCKGPQTDTESCIRRKCRASSLDTNFDNGFGMWRNVKTNKDPLDWHRGRGQVNTASGPKEDHTDGNGYYIYVPTTTFSSQKKATIVSQKLYGVKCISFAYMMNGKNVKMLDVFGKTESGQWRLYPLSNKIKGHKGKDWQRAQLTIGGSENYWFYFEATSGFGPDANIALDDIFIEEGKCRAAVQKKPKVIAAKACVNRHKSCVGWAEVGECHFNPDYMLKQCCLACRAMGNCNRKQYNEKECPVWASTGECRKNEKWMWKNCCKSCKKQGKCENKDNSCDFRAKEGFCKTKQNKFWMWKNCCPSCYKAKDQAPPCIDKNAGCQEWSNAGECKKNPTWMKNNCCKSCKAKDQAPPCIDKNAGCQEWSNTGECKKNPTWMKNNCCKSCKA